MGFCGRFGVAGRLMGIAIWESRLEWRELWVESRGWHRWDERWRAEKVGHSFYRGEQPKMANTRLNTSMSRDRFSRFKGSKNVIIAQNMPLSQEAITKYLVGNCHEIFIWLPGCQHWDRSHNFLFESHKTCLSLIQLFFVRFSMWFSLFQHSLSVYHGSKDHLYMQIYLWIAIFGGKWGF